MRSQDEEHLIKTLDNRLISLQKRIKKENIRLDNLESIADFTQKDTASLLRNYADYIYSLGVVDLCDECHPDHYDDNTEKKRKYIENEIRSYNSFISEAMTSASECVKMLKEKGEIIDKLTKDLEELKKDMKDDSVGYFSTYISIGKSNI